MFKISQNNMQKPKDDPSSDLFDNMNELFCTPRH